LENGRDSVPAVHHFQFFILTLFELVGEDTDPPELTPTLPNYFLMLDLQTGGTVSPLSTKV